MKNRFTPFAWRGLLAASLLSAISTAAKSQPGSWEARGVGGGGALFSPSFSPHNSNVFTIATDMSALFRSTDLGANWETVNFLEIQGNRLTRVHYTNDPMVCYSVDYTVIEGADLIRPAKSTDGGVTWEALDADPTGGEVFGMAADPTNSQRLLVSSYNALYISTNGGNSFSQRYTFNPSGNGLRLSGAFFDGDNIYVGTNAGLLVSTNGGASFAVSTEGGLPAGGAILSMAGAKEGGTVRLFAVITTEDSGAWVQPEDSFWSHQEVYTLDIGQPNWVAKNTGLPTDTSDGLAHIACALNDIDTAYVAGQRGSEGEFPMIYRTSNGGTSWTSVFTHTNNINTSTGWAGHNGDRGWSYDGGPTGFTVAPNDANRVAFSGYGFVHLSTDGGANWRQAYVNPADQNPPNAATPKNRSYRSVGLEDTSVWNLTWFDADNIWANFTDIRGLRSTDGGISWSFNYTGHTENTSYQTVVHPQTGVGYMASSTVHDIYQTTYLTDDRLDGGDGRINFTANQGATWQLLHDFNNPVIDVALDPNNPNRLYASVIDSSTGGIYRTENLNLGASATWAKLTNPPRTQGHPFIIKVLNDGTLVCTYSGRRSGGAFTQSSGVFVSTDDGASWIDRSHANMTYYVKDIVIDPHDPAQNTWYVGVWSGYGGPSSTNNLAGGLYRTVDRGLNWTRIWNSHRVSSITINPAAGRGDEAYVTTEAEGLWYTSNLNDPSPVFTQVASYPFREPKRVFFNPHNPDQVWVGSFGNGLKVGTHSASGVSEWLMLD